MVTRSQCPMWLDMTSRGPFTWNPIPVRWYGSNTRNPCHWFLILNSTHFVSRSTTTCGKLECNKMSLIPDSKCLSFREPLNQYHDHLNSPVTTCQFPLTSLYFQSIHPACIYILLCVLKIIYSNDKWCKHSKNHNVWLIHFSYNWPNITEPQTMKILPTSNCALILTIVNSLRLNDAYASGN